MLVYATAITARLQYMLQFVGEQWLGHPLEVTNERSVALAHAGLLISYSADRVRTDAFLVVPQGLLEQNDIREQDIVVDNSGDFPVFFHTSSDPPSNRPRRLPDFAKIPYADNSRQYQYHRSGEK